MPEVKDGPRGAKDEKIWIVVGDIHDRPENLNRIPELTRAEGIIVTGDLTNNGGVAAAEQVMRALEAAGKPVLAQIGNMDKEETTAWLEGRGQNLHRKTRALAPGVAIFGIGGSTPTPMNTPTEYGEEEYAAWLEREWEEAKNYPHKILVSHNPPKDTPCDAINPSLHVGSEVVRRFIEERQPDVCLCGHIHEGRASAEIGACRVVNPGQLADGGYAVLVLDGLGARAELKTLDA